MNALSGRVAIDPSAFDQTIDQRLRPWHVQPPPTAKPGAVPAGEPPPSVDSAAPWSGIAGGLGQVFGGPITTLPVARMAPVDGAVSGGAPFSSNDPLNEVVQAGVVPQESAAEIAAGEGYWYNTGINSGHWGAPPGVDQTSVPGSNPAGLAPPPAGDSGTSATSPSGVTTGGTDPNLAAILSLAGGGGASDAAATDPNAVPGAPYISGPAATGSAAGGPNYAVIALLAILVLGGLWWWHAHSAKDHPQLAHDVPKISAPVAHRFA